MSGRVKIRLGDAIYEEVPAIVERFGVARATISSWVEARAVEAIHRGNRVYVRTEDIEILTSFSAEETRAMGIKRTSDRRLAYNARYRQRMHDVTRPLATYHREEWDAISDALALDDDSALIKLALRLGRTWNAVVDRRTTLRKLVAS